MCTIEEKYELAFKRYQTRLDELTEEHDFGLLSDKRLKIGFDRQKIVLDARLEECPWYVTSKSLN